MESINVPRILLVCVGSELLRGKLNTHASYVSRRLASIGLRLDEENTVGDEQPEIAAAIRRGLQDFDVVLVSGGLGPTFDDLTREAASEATGRPLVASAALLKGLRRKFRRARYRMPKANTRQAYVLQGATVIENRFGTAPGQWLPLQQEKILVLLPGPPPELYPMLDQFVLSRLRRFSGSQKHVERHLHFVGLPESVVDHKVRPIIARAQSRAGEDRIDFTILARLGLVDLDIFVSSQSGPRAHRLLQGLDQQIRRTVGPAWYGSDEDYPLEKVVGDRFRKNHATLAVAESCTGGLLASRLTDIPGSSDYLIQGWVVYSNAGKMRGLGVPETMLKKHGAVSRPVAVALATRAHRQAESTWGIGITGIAGPGGGTRKKPVGLVFIALVSKTRSICQAYHFRGSREEIRQRTVLSALDILRRI